MSYTKDYYSILGLSASLSRQTSTADVRRAYKLALLAAHPDKNTGQAQSQYTVDEVKEAYTVLSDASHKSDYDNWLLRNPNVIQGGEGQAVGGLSSEFILGLETLDLSDFDVLDPGFKFTDNQDEDGSEGVERNGQMEWTRSCRCGDEKGFKILEEELEDAENRGEQEVLVGCEGCSLWVRVGFGVEEA
jgi:diphthamide biosynthesis protein 4